MSKYRIRCWIPVEPEEEEYYTTLEEAQENLEHHRFIQPENIYEIEEVDGEGGNSGLEDKTR